MKPIFFSHFEILVNGKTIYLVRPPVALAQYEDLFVVMVGAHPEEVNNQNVYAYDYDGNLVWRISPPHIYLGGDRTRKNPNSPYTGMLPDLETGLLRVYNCNGYRYFVDPKTGNVLKSMYIK